MTYPLVAELAADGIPIVMSCRVLGFSYQGFYKWRQQPCSDRDYADAVLTNKIIDIHAKDPELGYRFISDEVEAAGVEASENRVQRLCQQQQVRSVHAKKRAKNSKAGPPVHDDLVKRKFGADRPNQLWLTDITEHRTDEGKLYLCAIKDQWSKRLVGYSIGDRMVKELAIDAVRNAVCMRGSGTGAILHSDRGSQFRSNDFVAELKNSGLLGSMGRVGACGDNAAIETFFALLQKNVLDRRRWSTRAELRLAIVAWIESKYHRGRRQRGLGRLTPVEFESLFWPSEVLAA